MSERPPHPYRPLTSEELDQVIGLLDVAESIRLAQIGGRVRTWSTGRCRQSLEAWQADVTRAHVLKHRIITLRNQARSSESALAELEASRSSSHAA